jgi:tyrosyl-tRNA synthetase
MAEGLPTVHAKLPDGILNLAVAAGLVSSNSEARKLIANNGLKLNDESVSDPRLTIDSSALNSDGVLKLSSGKKKHVLIKPL